MTNQEALALEPGTVIKTIQTDNYQLDTKRYRFVGPDKDRFGNEIYAGGVLIIEASMIGGGFDGKTLAFPASSMEVEKAPSES